VDTRGNFVLRFNSEGMYRGSVSSSDFRIEIYKSEPPA
jgi:hypothetical protein